MANFGKIPDQSARGWTAKKAELVVGLGQAVELGLWGGGPGGADLEVTCRDLTVCTVHERQRPSSPGWRSFVFTGLRAGRTKATACLPGSASCWAEANVQVTATARGV